MRWLKRLVILILVVGALGALGAWYLKRDKEGATTFRTMAVSRGDLLATIGSTGTLQPEEAIDVGAQINGQLVAFGTDADGKPIDFNSNVEEGMVLARIDDVTYAADVASARASHEQAKASLQRARADLEQFKAKLLQAQREWERAQKLGPSDALSQTEYDAAESNYLVAKANIGIGDAAIAQAQAAVEGAASTLKKAERNFGFTTIRSPVKGVIIARRVNIGQTVVSSLNAPSLFLIAKDLSRLRIWASVNEADIGNIRPGQPVTFTVDAHPGRTFRGEVQRVRLDATMTQNVVTYTVEILADNADLTLRPYLTATIQFEVARKEDVLMVPNVALRWMPSSMEQVALDSRDMFGELERGGGGGRRGGGGGDRPERGGGGGSAGPRGDGAATGPTTRRSRGEAGDLRAGLVWVQEGAFVRPIPIRTGMTDGSNTQVVSDQLKEGMAVVTAEVSAADAAAGGDARNPFMPQFRRNRNSGGGRGR